jgi:drug/metabolite transporter (DMT)-like permease
MTKKNLLKGVILVGIGAIIYGMLATFVKMAYEEGYTTAEVTVSQFVLGILGMLIINAFQKAKKGNTVVKASGKNIFHLMLAGTSLGLTSIFYYLTVKFIPVSIAIVLLMQTVWIGVFLEMILDKKRPSIKKSVAVLVVLIGTALATNVLKTNAELDWCGIVLGILSAVSFTTTMFTANRVALTISSAQRSLFMLFGGAIMVFIFAYFTQTTAFNFTIFIKWGVILSLFGTIIPPLLMNAGFPYTGIGLGSIVAALELPVSVLMAYFILNEPVNPLQWAGIVLIILAIIMININTKKV